MAAEPIGREFDAWARKVLDRQRLAILDDLAATTRDQGYDCRVRSSDGRESLVEIKFFGTLRVACPSWRPHGLAKHSVSARYVGRYIRRDERLGSRGWVSSPLLRQEMRA